MTAEPSIRQARLIWVVLFFANVGTALGYATTANWSKVMDAVVRATLIAYIAWLEVCVVWLDDVYGRKAQGER